MISALVLIGVTAVIFAVAWILGEAIIRMAEEDEDGKAD